MSEDLCGKCGTNNCTRIAMLIKRAGMYERWVCNDCNYVTLHRAGSVVFTGNTGPQDAKMRDFGNVEDLR